MYKIDATVLKGLLPDDPWTHSCEGLDDCCFFCGCYNWKVVDKFTKITFHWHTCPWMRGRKYLQLPWEDEHERHDFHWYYASEKEYFAR